MVEKHCKWFFAQSPQNQDLGPNDAKFEIFKPDVNALVRESIQNSMDACADPSKPVSVAFEFKSLRSKSYPEMISGLDEAITGCRRYWKDAAVDVFGPIQDYLLYVKNNIRPMQYLTISDSNTKGMSYKAGDNKTSFHGFMHSSGASNKESNNAGGSFGIGKAAYFAYSALRTIIVSTMNSEGECTFQGETMLCTHVDVDDVLRTPIGFYANGNETPITDKDDIPDVFQRNEPGTEFNIMGVDVPDVEALYDELEMAVLKNFWYAILENKLRVTINGRLICQDNIKTFMETCYPDSADTGHMKNFIPRPYFEAVSSASNTNDGKHFIFETELTKLGLCRFYLLKHKDGRGRVTFYRMPHMLVMRQSISSSDNYSGVFICDNPHGDSLLRKLESVAHDKWEATNWKPRTKDGLKEAKAIIEEYEGFIMDCVDEAFDKKNQSTLDIKGLEDYLYIPTSEQADDDVVESIDSDPTGETRDDGNSPTSTKGDEGQSNSPNPTHKGRVSIEGPSLGGNTRTSGGRKGGHKADKRHHNPLVGGNGDSDGEGRVADIDVTYYAIAQNDHGTMLHHLIINAPCDVNNGLIELEVGRSEGKTEKLNIVDSTAGRPLGNTIKGLHLSAGMNEIIVRFADNLRHTIILSAYEIQQ
jgi:hypothetical protein